MITGRAALVTITLLLGACATAPRPSCRSGEQLEVDDTLYFGTGTPTGVVSADEWTRFLAMTVTPRFPQGLSVIDASGQWRGAIGTVVKEASHVLNLVHPEDAAIETHIAEIIATYKTQFKQEAVLRVRTDACVSF